MTSAKSAHKIYCVAYNLEPLYPGKKRPINYLVLTYIVLNACILSSAYRINTTYRKGNIIRTITRGRLTGLVTFWLGIAL